MKLIIDISNYDREWIKNTFGIPQDIDVAIARAIINGKALPDKHGRLVDADELKTAFPRCDNNMNIKIASVRATINHMDTIVEAEDSE